MANDTASTDPRLHEEARRAAAEAALPKTPALGYSPKAILQEMWDKIIDKKYAIRTVDDIFEDLSIFDGLEVISPMSEAEYRAFAEALCYGSQALFLKRAGEHAFNRSEAMRKLSVYALNERMGVSEDSKGSDDNIVDVRQGVVRKKKRPEGMNTMTPSSNPLIQMLLGLLPQNKL